MKWISDSDLISLTSIEYKRILFWCIFIFFFILLPSVLAFTFWAILCLVFLLFAIETLPIVALTLASRDVY